MPELPELETITQDLRSCILGKTITGIMTRVACVGKVLRMSSDELYEGVASQMIQTVIRRGKYIIMPLSNNNVLVFHLGMTGQLLVAPLDDGELWHQKAIADEYPHCHLAFELTDVFDTGDVELAFVDPRKFGKVWLVKNPSNIENLDVPGLRSLGPDALDITLDTFKELTSVSRRSVKSFLLDQKRLAGVGNIYADEACFVAKINPTRPLVSLDDVERARLWFAVKMVLKEGIKYRGSSVSDFTSIRGDKGSYQQKHRVYARTGKPCVECETPIEKTKVVGRSTHFCPSCQKRTGDK